jgi:hypothetical protein
MSKRLLSIYLVLVVLVAGLIPGCTGGGETYELTMAVNPTGGGTATDETGTSPYAQGTVVDIKAVAAAGYEFVNWSAPAGTFADANAAITTFTMPPQDVTVNASFVLVYDLTMAVNPAGSGTATDETGTSPYAQGSVVEIKAVAAAGYEFVNWSAPAGTFADANAAITTFTMPPQDVTVNATFVLVYDLTMAVNPAGSGTATDETGTSPYPEGTDVGIKAVANSPYQFFKWTAPAGTFDDEYAAITTFTMPADNVTVTANFAGPLDHATLYYVDYATAPFIGEVVEVKDQFVALNVTVGAAVGFTNAAQKQHGGVTTPIYNPDHHLTAYEISYEGDPGVWQVEVENQFGRQYLTVSGPIALCVPTQKEDHEAPLGLDHFLLYSVAESWYLDELVNLADQFGDYPEVRVDNPVYFGSPAQKTYKGEVTEIRNPDSHAVIYWISTIWLDKSVQVANQFGDEQALNLSGPLGLSVPSQKLSFAPLLDHFQCYAAEDSSGVPINADVVLEDQLVGSLEATVDLATTFANPAAKLPEGGSETPIWDYDHHFTIYDIHYTAEPGTWAVEVGNQFGGMQDLVVSGPVALAVPTQKAGHEFPVGLDHFLLYTVTVPPPPVDRNVELWDQFLPGWTWHAVGDPMYLGVPVKKTHGSNVTEIVNPEAHLVFYYITPCTFTLPGLLTNNQFGEQLLDVHDPYMLAVPSLKLVVDPIG